MDAISQRRSAAAADVPDPVAGPPPLAAAILHSRFPLRPVEEPETGAAPGLDIVSAHVDAKFYRARYPDVVREGVDPASHYHRQGWREGRIPNDWFDTAFYLQTYADVADAGLDPLLHYVAHGRAGGRAPRAPDADARPEPVHEDRDLAIVAANMDLVFYRGVYRDIDLPELDPVEHFHRAGWREGRNPSPWFDTAYYLRVYPDIRRADINPLLHYIRHGRAEGRHPHPPGGYRRAIVDRAMPPADRPAGYDAPDPAQLLDEDDLRDLLREACAGARGLVLSVSHDRYIDLTGGVQIFIADEQSWFNGDRFAYLHIAPAIARLTLDTGTEPITMQLVIDGSFAGLATYATIEAVLAELPPEQPPVRVFVVHSLFGHRAADLAALSQALGATACCFWLHDYATICEGYNLLRDDATFCNAPACESAACRICVYGANRATYRAELHTLFSAVPFEVLAPSRAALELWLRSAELPHRSARLQPHCRFLPAAAVPKAPSGDMLRGPARVAFVGYPLSHKGWPLFLELLRAAEPLGSYKFYHFCTEASRQPISGLTTVTAQVDRDDRFAMVNALAEHQIDLVLVLSPWPETFSYVTFEAFAAGADVIALADSGNVADAIRTHDRGVVLRDDQALLRFFTEFAAVHYVIDQRQAGRQPGAMRLVGTTATYDPAAPEAPVADLEHLATDDPLLGVIAGVVAVTAERDGDRYSFDLPDDTEFVRVVSRNVVPAAVDATETEQRRLGVAITELSLDGEPVPLDDARLQSGWHEPEPEALRWTNGNAVLLTDGARRLEFSLASTLSYQRCPLGDTPVEAGR